MVSYSLAREPVARGRLAGALGVSSSLLLAASVRWGHHWGPLADSIVAGWALSTVAAFVVAVWALRTSHASRRSAKLGIVLATMSVLALGLAGIVSAVGGAVAGACGGG
jgi:hypothetical protein